MREMDCPINRTAISVRVSSVFLNSIILTAHENLMNIDLSDEFSSQSDSSTDLTDIIKNESVDVVPKTPSLGKCRALYTYEARLNDELNLAPGK